MSVPTINTATQIRVKCLCRARYVNALPIRNRYCRVYKNNNNNNIIMRSPSPPSTRMRGALGVW